MKYVYQAFYETADDQEDELFATYELARSWLWREWEEVKSRYKFNKSDIKEGYNDDPKSKIPIQETDYWQWEWAEHALRFWLAKRVVLEE